MASMFGLRREPYNPALRGYHAVYHENAVNRCPGCGRSHWLIGRMLAECGFCGTALPLSESGFCGAGMAFRGVRTAGHSLAA